MMVRAALVGHAQPGPARAVLRQPMQLATASLPTGATLTARVTTDAARRALAVHAQVAARSAAPPVPPLARPQR